MNKPPLLPLMLGVSVCFHAGLFLFLSVKTSDALTFSAQKEQEETFSLVNIALLEPAVPVPPRTSPKPPPPEPLPVPEQELAEQYLHQAEESSEASGEGEDLGPAESPGHTGALEGAVKTSERTGEKAAQSAEYIKRNYRYLQKRIRDKLVYPVPARKAGIQGITQVSFTIHEDGRVSAVTVLKSSGHGILDKAALETIYAAAPFPRPPAPARIAIPIAFRLR